MKLPLRYTFYKMILKWACLSEPANSRSCQGSRCTIPTTSGWGCNGRDAQFIYSHSTTYPFTWGKHLNLYCIRINWLKITTWIYIRIFVYIKFCVNWSILSALYLQLLWHALSSRNVDVCQKLPFWIWQFEIVTVRWCLQVLYVKMEMDVQKVRSISSINYFFYFWLWLAEKMRPEVLLNIFLQKMPSNICKKWDNLNILRRRSQLKLQSI